MDTMPQPPAAPDLAASLRHLRRLAAGGALALALLGAAAGLTAPVDAAEPTPPPHAGGSGGGAGKVQMQDLTRKVNEYEGQHRLGVAGDPSQRGLAGGRDPEFPTTPGLTRKVNEYEGQHRLAGQDPEYPVTPNLAGGKDPEIPVTTG
jgi:hypothetical protein